MYHRSVLQGADADTEFLRQIFIKEFAWNQ